MEKCARTPVPSKTLMWKSVLVPLIREAGKAIITLFRRVLSQCFYVLELCVGVSIRKKTALVPLPFTRPAKPSYPHSRGRQSHHHIVLVPRCPILLGAIYRLNSCCCIDAASLCEFVWTILLKS